MKTRTTKKMQRLTGATALALLALVQGASAQEAQPECAVRIGGGPNGGVYELLVRDIQTVCGSTVSVCAVPSQGGLQNLMKLSSSEVDVGAF